MPSAVEILTAVREHWREHGCTGGNADPRRGASCPRGSVMFFADPQFTGDFEAVVRAATSAPEPGSPQYLAREALDATAKPTRYATEGGPPGADPGRIAEAYAWLFVDDTTDTPDLRGEPEAEIFVGFEKIAAEQFRAYEEMDPRDYDSPIEWADRAIAYLTQGPIIANAMTAYQLGE